jgi:hypothetical protein
MTTTKAFRIATGTAARLNVGTGANNVVQLGGDAKLPAVDGSQLTGLPAPTIASTAEAEAGTNNTNFLTPLRLREGFNAGGTAPVYACRAWVNFDGTTATPSTIRASGNVSSVTRNATGNYTVNFTTAMPDADYALSGSGSSATGRGGVLGSTDSYTRTTTAAQFSNISQGGTSNDLANGALMSVAIFR